MDTSINSTEHVKFISEELRAMETELDGMLTWLDITDEQRDDITRAVNLVGLAINRLSGRRAPVMLSAV